jgi:hypothetical protein
MIMLPLAVEAALTLRTTMDLIGGGFATSAHPNGMSYRRLATPAGRPPLHPVRSCAPSHLKMSDEY